MEGLHFLGVAAEQMDPATEVMEDVLPSLKSVDEEADVAMKMEEDDAPVLKMPTHKVEVVIGEKVQVPEEPILPDHYYDDGNIPVFKPVLNPLSSQCSNEH